MIVVSHLFAPPRLTQQKFKVHLIWNDGNSGNDNSNMNSRDKIGSKCSIGMQWTECLQLIEFIHILIRFNCMNSLHPNLLVVSVVSSFCYKMTMQSGKWKFHFFSETMFCTCVCVCVLTTKLQRLSKTVQTTFRGSSV